MKDQELWANQSTEELVQESNSAESGEWARAFSSFKIGKNEKSIDEYTFIGKTFITYVIPLFRKAWRSPLEREDMPGLGSGFRSDQFWAKSLRSSWSNEVALYGTKAKLLNAFRKTREANKVLIIGSISSVLQGILGAAVRPLVLRLIVSEVSSSNNQLLPVNKLVGLIFAFGIVSFAEGWLGVFGRQVLSEDLGTLFQNGLNGLVIEKLSNCKNLGQDAQHFMGNDLVRSYLSFRSAASLPMAIAGVISGVVVLLVLIGPFALVGISVMLVILMINVILGRMAHKYEKRSLTFADERLNILSSILQGSRAVKFFSWEDQFKEKILNKRNQEIAEIQTVRILCVTNIITGRASPVLSSTATLIAYSLSGETFTAATAFAIVSVFQALRLGLIMIPLSVSAMSSLRATCDRIEEYLFSPNSLPRNFQNKGEFLLDMHDVSLSYSTITTKTLFIPKNELTNKMESKPLEEEKDDDEDDDDDDANKKVIPLFNRDNFCVLRDVFVKIAPNKVVGVFGKVGSGKSTLLLAATQGLEPFKGKISSIQDIGYAPQTAFVISGTIKDNILLGRKYSTDLFEDAVFRSGLKYDLDLFQQKENTEVGERGMTLSGGQAARLNIARAIYGNPKLLILDDPLAAVDSRIGKWILDNIILEPRMKKSATNVSGVGSLSSSLSSSVFIAMNQISYAHCLDWILFLENGKISEQGTFQELMSNRNGSFFKFTETLNEQEVVEVAKEKNEEDIDANNFSENMVIENSTTTTTTTTTMTNNDKNNTVTVANDCIILKEENKVSGAVNRHIYIYYVQKMGVMFSIITLFFCLTGYSAMAMTDFWLSNWAEAISVSSASSGSMVNNVYYMSIYFGITMVFTILIMITSYMICFGAVRASLAIHSDMMNHILRAPMYWLEAQTLGRVMSRFGGDLSRVDSNLGVSLDNCIQVTTMLFILVLVVCIIIPYLFIIAAVSVVIYGILVIATDRALRESRRISNNAMSPVLSNVNELMQGRYIIRLRGDFYRFFLARHELASDEYARSNYAAGSCISLGFLSSHMISFVVSIIAAIMLLLLRDQYDSSFLALALTYAFLIPYFAGMSAQVTVLTSLSFLSLERVLEYENIPQELPHHLPSDPSSNIWPGNGKIEFVNVKLQYQPNLPLALKGVSFCVESGQSVGICGRTGAGKSSIVSCLFRLRELVEGFIVIDGINISKLGLHCLRSRMTIIPQDPILLVGTVRSNLDPFSERNDYELMQCLNLAQFQGHLDDPVTLGGSNWSQGQRQLLSLARALLLRRQILIMDEPTSNVDMKTDEIVQSVIQKEFLSGSLSKNFKPCTSITVAHRLDTIIMCDKVLVLKDGIVAEFEEPYHLLTKHDSELKAMTSVLGQEASSRLLHRASTNKSLRTKQKTI